MLIIVELLLFLALVICQKQMNIQANLYYVAKLDEPVTFIASISSYINNITFQASLLGLYKSIVNLEMLMHIIYLIMFLKLI